LIIPFIALTTLGTLAGALFSHYLLFPSMMAFFWTFDSPRMRFMPRVEDTFELYKNILIGMVAVFQIPTLVFFLARMQLVTARFLWRHIKYAILISFIAAAALTPSPDPWNQKMFAAPMIGLYVLSIGIAWIVAPRRQSASTNRITSRDLKLVLRQPSSIRRGGGATNRLANFRAYGAAQSDAVLIRPAVAQDGREAIEGGFVNGHTGQGSREP
jgi:sec-independent protein translocase protein TatC